MLHSDNLTRETKTLYYKVDSLTQGRVTSITFCLNILGIYDIATNLHFHQLRITVPKAMGSNIINLILSASGCSKVEAYIPPEVASWQSKSLKDPSNISECIIECAPSLPLITRKFIMALHGYDQFRKSQQQDTQTYTFTVSPLFCGGCLSRITTGLERNGISAICDATRYGQKDGNQAGDLLVTVNADITEENLITILKTKMGLKFPEASAKKGYGM